MEARFEDVDFARKAYTSVIKRTIDYGVRPSFSGLCFFAHASARTKSTTCCYYGTLHLEGTKVLADVIHSYGTL